MDDPVDVRPGRPARPPMSPMLPLLLDVRGRRVVVVGGGQIAVRRVAGLREAGAEVVVVAPRAEPELANVARVARPFRDADLDGAWLVIACTDDPEVNAAVASAAETRRVFCVRADDAGRGTARTSVVHRTDGVTIAVNGGDDPRRAKALRDAIAVALDAGDLPQRRHRRATSGSVALVGGGPGDPELITVRGRRLVADADVVVVDRLAPRELLAGLADDVEIVDCGKSAHRHNLSQDEINAVLVDRARAGKQVVRLKGGDPFVFGRGGEEWLACAAAGVPVQVVPGISSALAAPALAGIPVTHRQVAADFTVVSGHLDPGRAADSGDDAAWVRHLAESLTPRERECLALLVEGRTTGQMQRTLSISVATVRSHVRSLLAKLNVHSRLEAAALAVRYELLGDGPGTSRAG